MSYTQQEAREYLAEWIKPSTVIYTQTEYTRGSTDWVRVFVASKRNEIRDVTYLVGPAIGRKPKDRNGFQIGLPGGGYSKGLDIYLDIRYALKHQKPGSVEGQSKWREI
jgi:hypothetical protein